MSTRSPDERSAIRASLLAVVPRIAALMRTTRCTAKAGSPSGRRMVGAKRYPSLSAGERKEMGFAKGSTHPTGRNWCCQTGLNCRPLHYQWSALPLSYGSAPGILRIGLKGPRAGRSLPQGPRWRKRSAALQGRQRRPSSALEAGLPPATGSIGPIRFANGPPSSTGVLIAPIMTSAAGWKHRAFRPCDAGRPDRLRQWRW
jgi:hypothetical protein